MEILAPNDDFSLLVWTGPLSNLRFVLPMLFVKLWQTLAHKEAKDCASISSAAKAIQTTNKEACLQQNPVSKSQVPQAVHTPLIVNQKSTEDLKERTVAVASGWHESYGRWWQEQTATSDGTVLFGAQIIGDAQTPSKLTFMSLSDLACCRYAESCVLQLQCTHKDLSTSVPKL